MLVVAALFFYGYVLWEINGPVLKAVEKYLSEQR